MTKKNFWLFVFTPVIVTAVTLSTVLPIVIINKTNANNEEKAPDLPPNEPNEDDKNRVNIHTDIQQAYLNDKVENATLYARGVEELSRPQPHTISWESDKTSYQVEVSTNSDYSEPTIYNVDTEELSITNLKIDTEYFYRVTSESEVIKEDSFFTTNQMVRNMYVSGVTNVRDLGAYPNKNGKMKQGLIFRTANINSIIAKGKNTMLNEMKIKTEIDLRRVDNDEVGGLTEGVGLLGDQVSYYQCPMNYSVSYDEQINLDALKKVFTILGDSNNYPVFFHCAIGTDRTGYIAWLINGCLGVEQDALYRDYLFSNFGKIGGKRTKDSIKSKYTDAIEATSGNSYQEKATNFLLNRGVTQAQINTIKNMMLGQN